MKAKDINHFETGALPSTAQSQTQGWDSSDAWSTCAKALRDHDETVIKDWKEEIDTLLVFAGLFSAILTAFNIESYQLLQADTGNAVVLLLSQISTQLDSFSVNAGFINSTQIHLAPASPFRASPSAVRINTFWFSGLVCSLMSASLGILVKQWLREYLGGASSISRESIRIRQYRYEGMIKWRVPEIIACLPILLQMALVLFFAGLLDLLWSLHPVVAAVITVIVAAAMVFTVVTTFLPPLFVDCPYKSPQSWIICVLIQSIRRSIILLASHCYSYFWQFGLDPFTSNIDISVKISGAVRAWLHPLFLSKPYTSWKEREMTHVGSLAQALDSSTLAGADAMFMDDDFLDDVIRPCMKDIELTSALRCLDRIVIRRAPRVINGLPFWEFSEVEDKGTITMMHILLDMLSKINEEVDEEGGSPVQRHILMFMHRLIRAIPSKATDLHARKLFRRIFDTLACLLNSAPFERERSFHLMLKLFSRFQSIGPTCITAFIAYSRQMRLDNSPYRFMQACYMIISATASRDLPLEDYCAIQEPVAQVLRDLESFFLLPVSRTADYLPPISMRAECCQAVLALAIRDRDIITLGLVKVLREILTYPSATEGEDERTYATPDADMARQAMRVLERIYGFMGQQ